MLTTLLFTALSGDGPVPDVTPYTVPTAVDLKMRFPAFANVSDATINYWITDALAIVTTCWGSSDFRPAIMELAAHNMVKAGVPGIVADKVSGVAARGVTNFKSASFSASFDSSAAARLSGTGYGSTQYGADFAVRLRRNTGGPRLVGCGNLPGCY